MINYGVFPFRVKIGKPLGSNLILSFRTIFAIGIKLARFSTVHGVETFIG